MKKIIFIFTMLMSMNFIYAQNTIWIIGDSTVSAFDDNYYYPRYGWGTQVQSFIDTNKYQVKNIALSGRSSKSYIQDKEYNEFLQEMKKGDFLILGFGHNDEKFEKERYTDPNGDYNTQGSFANSLYKNYILQAKNKGVETILYTPIVRRNTNNTWTDELLHITKGTNEYRGGDYSEAIRKLGKELKIPVVDLTLLTKELYDKLGFEETLYLHAWTSSNPNSVDNTHTNIWGSKYNAYLFIKEIEKLNIKPISNALIKEKLNKEPMKKENLESNPNYTEKNYFSNQKESELWKDFGIFKGTVFGDIGGPVSKEFFSLGTDNSNRMNIQVKSNKGKIASIVDGMAMYYYKIPAGSTFELKADMYIEDFSLNNQVSFGLIARDEIYVDEFLSSPMGDYIAIAPLKLTQTGNVWNNFARKSGVLVQGGTMENTYKKGDTVSLVLKGNKDGFSGKFGQEAQISAGFDFPLTTIDSEYIYVGMFASRNANVSFYNIKLIVDGVEVY